MDTTGREDNLQKRINAYRKAMGSDYLGATFIELLLRLSEPSVDWVEIKTNVYAFYTQLIATDPTVAYIFCQGLKTATEDWKKGIDNG